MIDEDELVAIYRELGKTFVHRQHGPEPAGRDADLVQLLLVLGPVRGVQQLLQARQPNLEGAMKQDRQFGWVHQMILSVFRKSEKLA